MMKYRDSGCCLRCTLIVAVWSILEICRYCFYGCQLCIQGLSPLHSLLELFLSVSTSYPNLRVFHLHSWILTFRSATHEFSLSRCDRGVMAPKSIRSHFRCMLTVSVCSFSDFVWTVMYQFCVQGLWPLQYRLLLGTLTIPLPVLW